MSARNLAVGALVGYAAGHAMDIATTAFYERQSEESKRREAELTPAGAPAAAGAWAAGLAGWELSQERAAASGAFLHRAITTGYGAATAVLVAHGTPPMKAGVLTGALGFVLVDEGMGVLGIVPGPGQYPRESHLRGVVGHAAFGAALGAGLALARALRLLGRA